MPHPTPRHAVRLTVAAVVLSAAIVALAWGRATVVAALAVGAVAVPAGSACWDAWRASRRRRRVRARWARVPLGAR